ncbi:MAG TPA: hypothetical protein VF843_02160 [Streptosporangiaceae bacterium]
MTQWRIRVVLPDADDGRGVLTSALAELPVTGLRFTADGDGTAPAGNQIAGPPGDMIVELAEDSALDDLLRTLHEISPQVFISRVGDHGPVDGGRPIKVRRLAPGTVPG